MVLDGMREREGRGGLKNWEFIGKGLRWRGNMNG